ncbi:MAG: alpha/beta hydrolase [Parvularculaceae bacterium]|nr:alpha/beta hydrolase [Parvularculaceae bacterium]
MKEETGMIDGPNGRIAYRRIAGDGPCVVWFGGFKSDMTGTKAEELARWASAAGRAYMRFDYSGHGASEGRFEDGTISAWLADALAAVDMLTSGPLIPVGSSMGGWIAALAALRLQERLAGIVFIAPAPDFTEELMWNQMTGPERDAILKEGRLIEHSQYSEEPTIITRALIDDGRKHLILGGPVAIACPVRIIQGMADPDVPWRHALKFAERLSGDDVEMTVIKSGDHRLSKPHEIRRIIETVAAL